MTELLIYGLGGIGIIAVLAYFYVKGRNYEQFKQIKFNINEVRKIKKNKLSLRSLPIHLIKRKLQKYLRD